MNLKFLHPCFFFFLPFSCDVFSSRPVIIIYLFILQADIPPLSRRDVGRKSQRLNAVFSLYGGRSARGRPVRSQSCWIRLKKKKSAGVFVFPVEFIGSAGLEIPAEARRVRWHGGGGNKFTHKGSIIQGFGRATLARTLRSVFHGRVRGGSSPDHRALWESH